MTSLAHTKSVLRTSYLEKASAESSGFINPVIHRTALQSIPLSFTHLPRTSQVAL